MEDFYTIVDLHSLYMRSFKCPRCLLVENVLVDDHFRDLFLSAVYPDFKYQYNEYLKKYNTGEISGEVASYARKALFNTSEEPISGVVVLSTEKLLSGFKF